MRSSATIAFFKHDWLGSFFRPDARVDAEAKALIAKDGASRAYQIAGFRAMLARELDDIDGERLWRRIRRRIVKIAGVTGLSLV